MGNPFEEESPDLYSLDTKDVVESGIADEILKLADKGRDQYRTFLSRMRDGDNPGFYEPLKKNKYRLFNPKQKSESSKSKFENLKDLIYKNFSNMKIRNFRPHYHKMAR